MFGMLQTLITHSNWRINGEVINLSIRGYFLVHKLESAIGGRVPYLIWRKFSVLRFVYGNLLMDVAIISLKIGKEEDMIKNTLIKSSCSYKP